MNKDEKPWYSLKEAADYLNIDESTLQRKIIGLNFETTPLPGVKGEFMSRKDVLELESIVRGSTR